MLGLGALDPSELVILLVALVGVLPIVTYYSEETRLLVVAYGFLLFGAFATNAENLFLPDLLNLGEHVIGILGAGVMFAVAAYSRRKSVVTSGDAGTVGE